jgi:hypothetical protein
MPAQKYLKDKTPTQNLYLAIFDELPKHDMEAADLPELITRLLYAVPTRGAGIITRWFGLGRIKENPEEPTESSDLYEFYDDDEFYEESPEIDFPEDETDISLKDNEESGGLIRLDSYRSFQADSTRESFRKIGEHYGIGAQRTSHIKEKTLRMLRHPSRSKHIQKLFLSRAELRDQIDDLKNQIRDLQYQLSDKETEIQEAQVRYNELLNELPSAVEPTETPYGESLEAMTIEELDLSNRAFNCINRRGIHTIGDLITLDKNSLLKVRNLGIKSFEEIEDKLSSLGLSLKNDED